MKGPGNVLVGVAESDGAAVGTSGGVFGFAEGVKEPRDLFLVQRLIDFDGGMAGDTGRDAAAAGFGVFGLPVAIGDGEDFFEHALEFDSFETDRGGFDGEGAGAEGFGFEAVAVQFSGDLGEGDHLCGKEVDEQWHEEALALNLFGVAFAEDLFEKNAFVGYVLVDDPEALFVGG